MSTNPKKRKPSPRAKRRTLTPAEWKQLNAAIAREVDRLLNPDTAPRPRESETPATDRSSDTNQDDALPEAVAFTPRPGEPPRQPPGIDTLYEDLGSCVYSLLTMHLADPATLGNFRDELAERYNGMFPDFKPHLAVWCPPDGSGRELPPATHNPPDQTTQAITDEWPDDDDALRKTADALSAHIQELTGTNGLGDRKIITTTVQIWDNGGSVGRQLLSIDQPCTPREAVVLCETIADAIKEYARVA